MPTFPSRRLGQAWLLAARNRLDLDWIRVVGAEHVCALPGHPMVEQAQSKMLGALVWAFAIDPRTVADAWLGAARIYRACPFCSLVALFKVEGWSSPVWFSAAFGRSFIGANPGAPPQLIQLVESLVWGCFASQGVRTKAAALDLIVRIQPERVFQA